MASRRFCGGKEGSFWTCPDRGIFDHSSFTALWSDPGWGLVVTFRTPINLEVGINSVKPCPTGVIMVPMGEVGEIIHLPISVIILEGVPLVHEGVG